MTLAPVEQPDGKEGEQADADTGEEADARLAHEAANYDAADDGDGEEEAAGFGGARAVHVPPLPACQAPRQSW